MDFLVKKDGFKREKYHKIRRRYQYYKIEPKDVYTCYQEKRSLPLDRSSNPTDKESS